MSEFADKVLARLDALEARRLPDAYDQFVARMDKGLGAAITRAATTTRVVPLNLTVTVGGAAGGDLTGTYPDPTIGTNKVTLAKFVAATATQRVVGRNTAGTGNFEEVTVSQLLDWISSTQGAVLYRGASGWAALSPGTDGHRLTTHGAGMDPTWEA